MDAGYRSILWLTHERVHPNYLPSFHYTLPQQHSENGKSHFPTSIFMSTLERVLPFQYKHVNLQMRKPSLTVKQQQKRKKLLQYFSLDTQRKSLFNVSVEEVLKWSNFREKSLLVRQRNAVTLLEKWHYILLHKFHIPSFTVIAPFSVSYSYFLNNSRIKNSLP